MPTTTRKPSKIKRTITHVLRDMEALQAVEIPTTEQVEKYRALLAELAELEMASN